MSDSEQEELSEMMEEKHEKKKKQKKPKKKKMEEDVDLEDHDEDDTSYPLLATALGLACCPLTLIGSCFYLKEREEAVLLSFGKYNGTVKSPGCHWYNLCGREIRKVSTQVTSIDLPTTKVVDSNGNPLIVSGVLTYKFVNPKRCTLGVEYAGQYVNQNAQTVMKQVVSQYPYESKEEGVSLKEEAAEISSQLVRIVQEKVASAGAKILSFEFNELSYAPEIAAGMLKRQQASALVEARKIIVKGAVKISSSCQKRLEKKGIELDNNEAVRLNSNLLVVICGETDAQPVISL